MGARGLLAGLLGALLVAAALHLGRGPEPGPGLRLATRLDPASYRSQIEAIEAILYQERPAEAGEPEQVARLAAELAERIRTRESRLAGHAGFTGLLAFSAQVDAQGEAGYAAPDLGRPRAAWVALRAELFEPAPWLRLATPLAAEPQRRPEPTADPGAVAGLRSWARLLSAFVEDSRPEMLRFGEQYVDAAEGSAAERKLAEDWNRYARRFDERLQEVARHAPPQPPWDGEPHLVAAHQRLGEAVQRLRTATVAPGELVLPDKAWRRENLDGAAALVEDARRELAQAREAELQTFF
jgi:hypothetical protein